MEKTHLLQGVPTLITRRFSVENDLGFNQVSPKEVLLQRLSSGEPLARVSGILDETRDPSLPTVEFFDAKGGFIAIITSPQGTRYFALPGAEVTLDGITVQLAGEPICPNPLLPPSFSEHAFQPISQTVTPHAAILGAGLATRFEPVSGDYTGYAKPAVPLVGQRSVIRLIAERLVACGVHDIFINTFYMRDSLKQGLEGLSGATLHYMDEPEPSGTAGGLRKVFENPSAYPGFVDMNQPVLVVQGDAVTDVDFSALMEAHIEKQAAVTIGCMVKPDEDVHKFGIIATDGSGEDGQSGRIQMFLEKPSLAEAGSHRLANTGFYIFSPETFSIIGDIYRQKRADARVEKNSRGEVVLDFAMHVFPEILRQTLAGEIRDRQGQVKPFWAQVVRGYWSDIGNPAQYVQSVRDIYAGLVNIPLPENRSRYYDDNGIIYWPGAKERAQAEQARMTGNVIVALPFQSNPTA